MSATEHRDDRSEQGTKKTIKAIGYGHRLAAMLLDAFLLGFLSLLVVVAIGFVGGFLNMYTPNQSLLIETWIVVALLVFSVAYYVAAWAKTGQTIGKTVLGIKIVGADGQPPSGARQSCATSAIL